MREHRALVVVTATAARSTTNGAGLRVGDVVAVLREAGLSVRQVEAADVPSAGDGWCLGVAVSYAGAGSVRALGRLAPAVWLDCVDSWLAVNLSGMRAGRPSYLARGVRDAARLALMPQPDLATWISQADRAQDGRTVRAARRLVLPARPLTPALSPARGDEPRAVLVGDWTYAPNRDGLAWFRSRCLPLVEQALGTRAWSAHVYGTGAPDLQGRLQNHGWVEDEAELYRTGDVHVAPVAHGGGVKRKVLQPLLAGLPVVTTPSGAHGLRRSAGLDVCASPRSFAGALARRLVEAPPVLRPTLQDVVDADDSAAVLAWLRERATCCGHAGS